eukprot:COSAG01_NODE_5565_length_4179_cov_28.199392_5_plen_132_part_00
MSGPWLAMACCRLARATKGLVNNSSKQPLCCLLLLLKKSEIAGCCGFARIGECGYMATCGTSGRRSRRGRGDSRDSRQPRAVRPGQPRPAGLSALSSVQPPSAAVGDHGGVAAARDRYRRPNGRLSSPPFR